MKRNKAARFTALMWSSLLLYGTGLPVLAQEQNTCDEPHTVTSEPATPQPMPSDFFVPVPATDAEIKAIANSNLKADIHARDLKGNWTKETITLKKSNIFGISIINRERTEAWGYINFTCYPEGYISYSGIFDGAENAGPTYSDLGFTSDSEKYIGMGTNFNVLKNENGEWAPSYDKKGLDYWCCEMPAFEQLKDVKIRFRSDKTGKTYEIPLIKDTYEGISLNESHFQGAKTSLIIHD